jgi:molecular chaperone HtpG
MAKDIKKPFGTDTAKILEILTHRLYSESEIFLKELISNGSDACNKINFLITSGEYKGENYQKKILIDLDEDANILTIIDNGIGMDDDDMDNFLGTIASSNTRNTIEKLNAKNDLIGQFGIGFYSCFMVADEVQVWSKKYDSDRGFLWQSNGKDSYEIIEQNKAFFTSNGHGTQVKLILKEDFKYLTNKYQIMEIIKKYSNYVNVPIVFYDEQDKNEIINKVEIPWRTNNMTKDIAKDIYKQVLHRNGEIFKYVHQKLQGKYDYTRLLYIPGKNSWGMDRQGSFQIYLNGVFVSNELEFLPQHMRFASGIIEFQDMPINISRENFLQNPFVEQVKNSIKHKILEELIKSLESNKEEYIENFWNFYGKNLLKTGLMEDFMDRTMIFDACLFRSAKKKTLNTLREYVKEMEDAKVIIENFDKNDNEKVIYYITSTQDHHPLADTFMKEHNQDVLIVDELDKMIFEFTNTYEDKKFVNILNQQKSHENSTEDHVFVEKSQSILKDIKKITLNSLEQNILGYKVQEMDFITFQKPMINLVFNINHPLIAKAQKNINNEDLFKENILAVYNFLKIKETSDEDSNKVLDKIINSYIINN